MQKVKQNKKDRTIFRSGEETAQELRDLRIMHPGWNKSRIIREAIHRMKMQDCR